MTPARMAEIHKAAFRTQRPWSKAEFEDLLSSQTVFPISENDGCFALGRIIAGEAELLTIATHPDHHRRGLARKCLTQFLARCKQEKCDQVFLEVDTQNPAAIALYQAFDFTESGRRKNYYRCPNGTLSDAVLMTLPLGQ